MGMADTSQLSAFIDKQQTAFEKLSPEQRMKAFEGFEDEIESLKVKIKKALKWTDDQIEYWMQYRNPELGYISPQYMVACGRIEKLTKWVDCQLDEIKAYDEKE